MAQLYNAIIKQMMSTAMDAELIALGERFEKLLLEYVDAWLAWAPLMRAARADTYRRDTAQRLRRGPSPHVRARA
jgi:hypothetical protein